MNPTLFKLSLIIILAGTWSRASAQDAHYWSEQFGNKSMLLGGTVNASVEDLGLVYYNPGRLAKIENPAFVISARVYELSNVRITDGLGEGKDLKKTNFGGGPSLVAGTFKLPFLKDHHFAYGFLTRYKYKNQFDVLTTVTEDEIIQDIEYDELSSKLRSNNSYNEEWYGLTWSYNLNKKLSIGITTFGFQTNSNGSIELLMQGLKVQDEVSMLNYNRQLNYTMYGILWKAGLAAEFKNITLGLTVTTPKVPISGKGSSAYESYVTGIDTLNGIAMEDIYIENHQSDLPANLKSSWAIGFGIGIKFPKTTIHISSEWFDKIDGYTVMEAEEFIGQQPDSTINFRLLDELQSVINFGIGIEHKFSEKLNIYASFATDFSAVNSDGSELYEFKHNDIANSSFDGDLFHLGTGVSLNLKWAELTMGATYASSESEIQRPLNIGNDVVIDPNAKSTLIFSRWRFLVGFSFPFANKVTDKLGVD